MDEKKEWLLGGAGCLVFLALVVLAMVGWAFATYNSFVGLDQNVQEKWSVVESNLQRRADLIPNLVATVKGSAKLDSSVYTQIADARAKLAGGGSIPQRVDAANRFEGALSRLLMVVENYPQLKSQEGFRQLQDELAGTENRLNIARKDYNEAVAAYNTAIGQLPGSLIASMAGRKPEAFFKAAPESQAVPKVNFQ